MANTISLAGISPGSIIEADQLTRVIYALNGVSGSDIIMSGSLGVTGSAEFSSSVIFFAGATGSLFGTSSWALNAITASYALNAAGSDTGSLIVTASFSDPNITFTRGNGSTFLIDLSTLVPNTPSFAITASYFSGSITDAVSSSYALSASYAFFATSASFASSVGPLTGSTIISSSLNVTGSANITGSLFVNGLLVGADTGAQLGTWRYTSSLNTGIDPTNGYFSLNAVWSSSPNSASFDNFAFNPNVSFSGYLDNLTIGTVIKLVSLVEGGTYKLLQIVSVNPPESGYETYGVSQLTGAGNDPNDGDQFAFIPVGASGQGFNTIANPGPGRVILSDGSTNAASASANLIFTGSNFLVTGSTIFNAIQGETNIVTVKSGSVNYLTINTASFFDIYSNLFNVRNQTTQQPVLTVSGSIVQIATHSIDPTGTAPNGGIYFTSTSFYIGLD